MRNLGSGWRWAATVAVVVTLVGCGSTSSVRSRADANEGTPIAARLTTAQANDVTIYAIGLVGTPYRFGGNTPASGFDCSGLIGHVYKERASVQAPRTVSQLRDWGQGVTAERARTGDLVVFLKNGVATHAGILVGEGRFVHAPSTGGTVRLDSLTSKHWAAQPVLFRRP